MRLRNSFASWLLFCGGCTALGSCSLPSVLQPAGRAPASVHRAQIGTSCYKGGGGQTNTVSATVTFYGWPDNSPPGDQIAHPVIHQVAAGDGSFCNPTTFATEPTSQENKRFPYGVKIYVPFIKKYFLREDDCTNSGPSHLGCKGVWFDLWIGGTAKSNFDAVIDCEDQLTPNGKVPVIIHPPDGEPVAFDGPIYNDNPPPNGTCNGPG